MSYHPRGNFKENFRKAKKSSTAFLLTFVRRTKLASATANRTNEIWRLKTREVKFLSSGEYLIEFRWCNLLDSRRERNLISTSPGNQRSCRHNFYNPIKFEMWSIASNKSNWNEPLPVSCILWVLEFLSSFFIFRVSSVLFESWSSPKTTIYPNFCHHISTLMLSTVLLDSRLGQKGRQINYIDRRLGREKFISLCNETSRKTFSVFLSSHHILFHPSKVYMRNDYLKIIVVQKRFKKIFADEASSLKAFSPPLPNVWVFRSLFFCVPLCESCEPKNFLFLFLLHAEVRTDFLVINARVKRGKKRKSETEKTAVTGRVLRVLLWRGGWSPIRLNDPLERKERSPEDEANGGMFCQRVDVGWVSWRGGRSFINSFIVLETLRDARERGKFLIKHLATLNTDFNYLMVD